MDDQDIRMECLRLATEACGLNVGEITATAERMYRWVKGAEPDPRHDVPEGGNTRGGAGGNNFDSMSDHVAPGGSGVGGPGAGNVQDQDGNPIMAAIRASAGGR